MHRRCTIVTCNNLSPSTVTLKSTYTLRKSKHALPVAPLSLTSAFGCSISQKLSFPRYAYFLDGGALTAYTLRAGTVAAYKSLPVGDSARCPHHMVSCLFAFVIGCRQQLDMIERLV